jgi:hypothetical protein
MMLSEGGTTTGTLIARVMSETAQRRWSPEELRTIAV